MEDLKDEQHAQKLKAALDVMTPEQFAAFVAERQSGYDDFQPKTVADVMAYLAKEGEYADWEDWLYVAGKTLESQPTTAQIKAMEARAEEAKSERKRNSPPTEEEWADLYPRLLETLRKLDAETMQRFIGAAVYLPEAIAQWFYWRRGQNSKRELDFYASLTNEFVENQWEEMIRDLAREHGIDIVDE